MLKQIRTDRFDFHLLTTPLEGNFRLEDQLPTFLELMRWPKRITCPHCHSRNIFRFRKAKRKPEARYLYNCRACRRQFTVTVGTPLHRTHIPLSKWLEAIALIRTSRGSRNLKASVVMHTVGVTHKTAQLICRRLRRGMKGPFVRNLCTAMWMYKKIERIFRNIYPSLYEE